MNRWTKTILAGLLGVVLTQPLSLPACTVCYGGGSDSTLGQGMGWGIFALLCTIMTVLGGIALFFVHVIRREAALAATGSEAASTPEN